MAERPRRVRCDYRYNLVGLRNDQEPQVLESVPSSECREEVVGRGRGVLTCG